MILSILKKVFHQILRTLTTRSDTYRSPDLAIFVSTTTMMTISMTTTTEPIALSLVHVLGVNNNIARQLATVAI